MSSKKVVATLDRGGLYIDKSQLIKKLGWKKYNTMIKKMTEKLSRWGRGKIITEEVHFYRMLSIPSTRKIIKDGIEITEEYKKNIIVVARFYIPYLIKSKCIDGVRNITSNGLKILDNKFEDCSLNLRPHQVPLFDYLSKNVFTEKKRKQGLAGCTFVLDTGQGKSFVAAKLIEHLRLKTLIIVPGGTVFGGWIDVFDKFMPNVELGFYSSKKIENGKRKNKCDGDVVLMIINSALATEYKFTVVEGGEKVKKTMKSKDYFSQFGLVIFDEIPSYVKDKYRQIYWRTNFSYTLGLTATPDERTDGLDIVYKKHVGPLVFAEKIPGYVPSGEIDDSGKLKKFKGSVDVIMYSGPSKYTLKKEFIDRIIQISMDPYRNRIIVQEIVKLYNEGKYVFVFTELRDHIAMLHDMLLQDNIFAEAPEIGKIHTLKGGVGIEAMKNAKKHAKLILITYSYGSVGTSIPKMDAMVCATPRRSGTKQLSGRILRLGGNMDSERKIIDIVDIETNLKNQYNKGEHNRKKVYESREFPISERYIDWYAVKPLCPTQLTIDLINKQNEEKATEYRAGFMFEDLYIKKSMEKESPKDSVSDFDENFPEI